MQQKKDSVSSVDNRYNSGVSQVGYSAHASSRDKEYSRSLGQEGYSHKLKGWTQDLWALHPLIRKCSSPKAHSYAIKWKLKDCS